MGNYSLWEILVLKFKQMFCAHGPFETQDFEHDCGNEVVSGFWLTCTKCGKSWEKILHAYPTPPRNPTHE